MYQNTIFNAIIYPGIIYHTEKMFFSEMQDKRKRIGYATIRGDERRYILPKEQYRQKRKFLSDLDNIKIAQN